MTDALEEPTPELIMSIGLGYRDARVLHAALELDLFTRLADDAVSAADIAERTGIHDLVRDDFLDVLAALGLLVRSGESGARQYANTPSTRIFLSTDSPAYMGGMLHMSNNRTYDHFSDLIHVVRTGEPSSEIRDGGNFFETLYRSPEQLERFLEAMKGVQLGSSMSLAMTIDFAPYSDFCDVGGGNGAAAGNIAMVHQHLRGTVFDLPEVEPLARKQLAAAGVADRVTSVGGDFFTDALPEADVILMGSILHDWDAAKKQLLIGKAFDAVRPGGIFVCTDMVLDDDRSENVMGLMNSMHMHVEFGDAGEYTGSDFDAWCRAAGFERTEVRELVGPIRAAIAYKA